MNIETLAACFRDTRPNEEDVDFVQQFKQWSLTRNRVAMRYESVADASLFISLSDIVKPR